MSATADRALEAAAWDLEPLVESKGAEGVEELLLEARDRATAFAERHRGAVGELGPDGLADAMHELAAIYDLAGRAASYAMLSFTLDTADPARGALIQKAQELGASIETQLLFFELEWNLLPDERAEELLAGPELDFCRHHLRSLRRYRPHQLSEPEERVMTELDVTGSSAFRRLFTEQVSGDRGRAARRRRAGLARGRAESAPASGPRAARAGRARDDGRAAARPAHARVPVQHPARRQGDQGPAARLPPLARVAQPRQRGERRVGRGADRGRRGALRAGAALVPAQGPPARPGAARLLGSRGAGGRHRRARPL